MHSLSSFSLVKLCFYAQQLATLRALGEYRGKQQLYVAQSPEVLSDLRQVAVVESTESSNRLEGVIVAAHRLKSLVLKNATPKSRSEQEVAGYRDALSLIHILVNAKAPAGGDRQKPQHMAAGQRCHESLLRIKRRRVRVW